MRHRLADIMQQTAALRQHHINAKLCSHDACQMGNLDGVVEHILSVARAIAQAAQKLHQFRMNAMDTGLESSLFTGLLDSLLHFTARLLYHFLNARRMDTPVHDELLQCDPRDLAAHRIESRDDHRFRRIINDQINAGHRLQRADVPPFSSDDASFHLVIWQRNDGHRCLSHMIRRTALDRQGQNLPRLLVGLILDLLLVLLDLHGFFMLQFCLGFFHQHGLCLICRQGRDAFQLFFLLFVKRIDLRLRLIQTRFLAAQGILLFLQRLQLAVQILLFLDDSALLTLDFPPALFRITIKLLPHAMDLLLRFQHGLLLFGLAFGFRVRYDSSCFFLGRADLRFRCLLAHSIAGASADHDCNDYR